MANKSPRDRRVIGFLLVILALGTAFRFCNLGLVRHSYDDSYPAYDALRMLDAHRLVLIGQPSSISLNNPVLMSYLQAVPLLIWRSPWAVYLFIITLNSIAVWFVYRSAQRLLGNDAALLCAFLFAINPWLVYFSRDSWVQALIPFFTAVIAWGLWPTIATEHRSSRGVLITSLALTGITQTYVQAWGVLIQVGLLLILFRQRIPRRPLYIGMLIFIVAMAAHGVSLSERWEANRRALLEFFTKGELHLTREGLDHAFRLVTGRDFEYVHGRAETSEYKLRRTFSLAADYLLCLALLAGIAHAVIELRRHGPMDRTAAVLLAWFLTPILLMTISAHPVHPHYLLLSCPAGHMLAAWGITPLLRRPAQRWGTMLALLAIAILFGANLYRDSAQVASMPTGPGFDNWALSAGAQVGAVVRHLAKGDTYPRRVYAEGHDALLSSLSGMYITALPELDFPSYIILPSKEPLVYVVVNAPPEPEALGPLQESFPQYNLLFADGTQVSFLRAPPYSREAALALPEVAVDWPSEAGLSMLGYTLDTATRPIQCTTYWRVEALYPGREEWYIGAFYHLLNQAGQIITNISGHGQWGYRWELGDVYVDTVGIPVPSDLALGEYRIAIGLFDCIHTRRYPLRSPDGSTDAIFIPITVRSPSGG